MELLLVRDAPFCQRPATRYSDRRYRVFTTATQRQLLGDVNDEEADALWSHANLNVCQQQHEDDPEHEFGLLGRAAQYVRECIADERDRQRDRELRDAVLDLVDRGVRGDERREHAADPVAMCVWLMSRSTWSASHAAVTPRTERCKRINMCTLSLAKSAHSRQSLSKQSCWWFRLLASSAFRRMMMPLQIQEAISAIEGNGSSGSSRTKSAGARKHKCIRSTAQALDVWMLLQTHTTHSPPCDALHIPDVALSEALLMQEPHERDAVLRVLTAQTITLSLCALDLSYNHLDDAFVETLAQSAAERVWPSLVTLNVANNMFTSMSLPALAQMLARCPKLAHLDMSINPLQSLPQKLAPRQATQLTSDTADSEIGSDAEDDVDDVHALHVRALAQALAHTELSVLDLSCTGLTDSVAAALLESMAATRLTKLYLRSNDLHDATAIAIAARLPTMQLQVLSLAGNFIANEGLGALAFAIETSATLETLDVDENHINERGLMALYHVIDGLTAPFALRRVHVKRNRVTDERAPTLLAALAAKLQEKVIETYLRRVAHEQPQSTLVLTGTTVRNMLRLDSVMTDRLVAVALDAIRYCDGWSRLEALDLSDNAVSEHGCSDLGLYVSLHPCLRVLNLSRSAIDDCGVARLADGLERNATLQELNLHDNAITDAGAKLLYLKAFTSNLQRKVLLSIGNKLTPACKVMLTAISQAHDLRKRFTTEFAHREQLDFAGRSLRQYGVAAIVEMLTQPANSPACTAIDLSRNGLGDDGALEVVRLLRDYEPLRKLDLSFNDIGDTGAFALADALRDNATLTHLVLHTSVEGSVVKPRLLEAGLTRLAQALATHPSIVTIDLRDNITTPTLVPVYVQMLRCNPRIVKFNGSSAAVYLSRHES